MIVWRLVLVIVNVVVEEYVSCTSTVTEVKEPSVYAMSIENVVVTPAEMDT